jgi:nicotinate-nucleotide adenylyltransferase
MPRPDDQSVKQLTLRQFQRPRPRRHNGRRIGLLGGSFNPAHHGHREISERALKTLGLDEIWWLVSPQNPLKQTAGMAPFDERLSSARDVASHGPLARHIRVSDLEQRLGTRYSVDTVTVLRQRYSRDFFVWIMGADNLVQMPDWHRWQDLMQAVPVVVFDRPGFTHRALSGLAARRFAAARLDPRQRRALVTMAPPAWVYLRDSHNPVSATQIRDQQIKRSHI